MSDKVDEEKFLLSRAIRPSQITPLDKLLASKLALALMSDPLNKIRHAIEAYLALDEEKRSEINLSEEGEMILMRIYAVAITLLQPLFSNHGRVKVGWPFPLEEAYEYLHPWLTTKPLERGYVGHKNTRFLSGGMSKKWGVDQDTAKKYIDAYILLSSEGSTTFYLKVRNSFICYAVPLIEELISEMFKKMVDPDIWDHMLRILSGGVSSAEQRGATDKDMVG